MIEKLCENVDVGFNGLNENVNNRLFDLENMNRVDTLNNQYLLRVPSEPEVGLDSIHVYIAISHQEKLKNHKRDNFF